MNPDEGLEMNQYDIDEAAFKGQLDALAASVILDPSVAEEMEYQLRRTHHAQLQAQMPDFRRWLSGLLLRRRFAVGLVLALLLSFLVGIPVLAQMGLLKYFVPYEVGQYPSRPVGTAMPFEPVTAPDLASLERAVGWRGVRSSGFATTPPP